MLLLCLASPAPILNALPRASFLMLLLRLRGLPLLSSFPWLLTLMLSRLLFLMSLLEMVRYDPSLTSPSCRVSVPRPKVYLLSWPLRISAPLSIVIAYGPTDS
ncbi:hypothetical protein HanIR_Chr06g0288271 [Helianthus annuus]|nr:hypothetical protein HanIR_Chr06g0288271 [Helianthus annuus]